jgi:Tfp pilus assembly protein PilO
LALDNATKTLPFNLKHKELQEMIKFIIILITIAVIITIGIIVWVANWPKKLNVDLTLDGAEAELLSLKKVLEDKVHQLANGREKNSLLAQIKEIDEALAQVSTQEAEI